MSSDFYLLHIMMLLSLWWEEIKEFLIKNCLKIAQLWFYGCSFDLSKFLENFFEWKLSAHHHANRKEREMNGDKKILTKKWRVVMTLALYIFVSSVTFYFHFVIVHRSMRWWKTNWNKYLFCSLTLFFCLSVVMKERARKTFYWNWNFYFSC